MSDQRRLPSLTSLRWFAASAVFFRHVAPHNAPPAVTDLATTGAVGVSFFFILSGFVLAWSYRPDDTPRAFYRRRFARIAPAYWVVCLAAIPILIWIDPTMRGERALTTLYPFTFLQSWVPDQAFYYAGNGVSWSLSDEAFFYVLFPALIGSVIVFTRAAAMRLLAGLLLVAIIVPLALHPLGENDGFGFWFVFINPVLRLAEFLIGIALCVLVRRGVRAPLPPLAAAVLVIVAYVAAGQLPIYLMWVATTVVPFALLIWACAQADLSGLTPRLLGSRALINLGQWSYAFYLVHFLVIGVLVHVTGTDTSRAVDVGRVIMAYAASTAVAYLLFRFVEHPLERQLRHGGTAMPSTELELVR